MKPAVGLTQPGITWCFPGHTPELAIRHPEPSPGSVFLFFPGRGSAPPAAHINGMNHISHRLDVTITSDRTFLLECSPFRPFPWRSFPRTVRRELGRLNRVGILTNATALPHSETRVLVYTQAFAATNSPAVALLRNAVARRMAKWWHVKPEEIGYSSTRLEF